MECQAWQETALVAKGKMEVPRLRSGRRVTSEPTEEEVSIVATAVGAEGGRRTLGKRNQGEGKKWGRGRSAGKGKKAKRQDRDGVQSDRGQGWQATAESGGEGQGGPGASKQGGVLDDSPEDKGTRRQSEKWTKEHLANRKGGGARRHAAVPDGAGARVEQQNGGHEWRRGLPMGCEDGVGTVARWDTDSL